MFLLPGTSFFSLCLVKINPLSDREELLDRQHENECHREGYRDPRSRTQQLLYHQRQEASTEILERANREAREAEIYGTSTLEELVIQRETIIRTKDALDKANENLSRSDRILRKMKNAVVLHRVTVAVIVFVLALIICLIVFLVVTQ